MHLKARRFITDASQLSKKKYLCPQPCGARFLALGRQRTQAFTVALPQGVLIVRTIKSILFNLNTRTGGCNHFLRNK